MVRANDEFIMEHTTKFQLQTEADPSKQASKQIYSPKTIL